MADNKNDMDNTDYHHTRLEAGTASQLDELILAKQKEGFELVNAVYDGRAWHAFMKSSLINCDFQVLNELETLNSGIGMLINNEPKFVTTGHLDEVKSVLECVLSALEGSRD
ncbi:hypothetical protein [Neorhodopirellula pilleata]|uniref:Uncharacterized protein n=1 Tax=Neorhodopirellula pilleata TaxID=2714738 RepID=A0A5C5ZR95_9BACT|nr:hypothetical protein [Neorhodopirellula pilleata]TWT89321.1 hypothetical protein Pla100_56380 [Neorhodopirellula pilleata]